MTDVQHLPLRDIHLPEAVSWWPPGLGWWLLPPLLGALLWVVWRLGRYWRLRRRAGALRRAALRELDAVEADYRASGDARLALAAISVLLKRFALSIAPRSQVAALTGQRWLQWLRQRCDAPVFAGPATTALLEQPYQPDPQLDVTVLLAECRALVVSARAEAADAT
jgi:hypothetical protein